MTQINNPFDELDYRIIQELRRDARASASEIARAVGAHERTVRKRIDRLVALEAIRLTAVVNPRPFGYTTAADIFLDVDPAHEEEVIQALLQRPEISYLAYGQGNRDISIEARFQGSDALHDFLRHTLLALPGVKVTGYALVPRVLRNIDEWMPAAEDFQRVNEEASQRGNESVNQQGSGSGDQ